MTRALRTAAGSRQMPRLTRPMAVAVLCLFAFARDGSPAPARPDRPLPELTQPVNDFAKVIDESSRTAIDALIRRLQTATGDVVVVATVATVEPYADIREYAVRLFENHGRGIGEKGKDNGVLILLALKERRVWIEAGYGLEQWITDGFAGETSREYLVPAFRNGRYGAGLLNGTGRVVARIARGRNVTLTGVELPRGGLREITGIPFSLIILLVVLGIILVATAARTGGGPRGGIRNWGGGPWSGWSSGVGPFGGGWTGGGGGFGGGFGGFGGFGGGRSGGGGGGAGW